MSQVIDLTNQIVGRLTIVKKSVPDKRNRSTWLCKCACGNKLVVSQNNLLRKIPTRSCGCLQRERSTTCNIKHGRCYSLEYRSWNNMLKRCYDPTAIRYERWGGRGITVCSRWHTFENFFLDMGERPDKTYSLDRIDNDGNYCKDNCRWASPREQSRNRKSNVKISYNGLTMLVSDWAKHLGLSPQTIRNRVLSGKSFEEAFSMRKWAKM